MLNSPLRVRVPSGAIIKEIPLLMASSTSDKLFNADFKCVLFIGIPPYSFKSCPNIGYPNTSFAPIAVISVSYTHLRAHET